MPPTFDSFIFTHIPKCGGTSFRKYIYTCARNSGIARRHLYVPGFGRLNSEKNFPQLSEKALAKVKRRKWKVIANHAYYDIVSTYGLNMATPFYYTLLRHPVERFLSHYYHFCFRRGDWGLAGKPLDALDEPILRKVLQLYANIALRYVAGQKGRPLTEASLEQARYNLLHSYGAYGILEDMDTSLRVLRQKAPDWLRLDGNFPYENPNPPRGELPPQLLRRIERHNALELTFYETALLNFGK